MVIMPPKRAVGSEEEGGRPRKRRRMPPKGTQEYKEKRDRNNVAVKKSREKTRDKAKQTVDRVAKLREENKMLEQQVEILSKELTILKDLFKMVHDDSARCPINNAEISVQTEGAMEVLPSVVNIGSDIKNSQESLAAIKSSPDVAHVKTELTADHDYTMAAIKPEKQ